MLSNDEELEQMLKQQQNDHFSSSEQDVIQHPKSKNQFRKPIDHPFSQHSSQIQSDSDNQLGNNLPPFPPKQPKAKSAVQQAQESMKWNNNQQIQIDILSKLEGQGIKQKKIRQLANKLKCLNVQYQKEKTIRKGLQSQLNNSIKISQDNKKKSIQKETKKSVEKDQNKTNKIDSSKCLSCKESQKKIMQFRLKSQNLQTQLNKAIRIIKMEIGQNFNIDQVLSQESTWKGRQQKIQKLKYRVKQLQQKLQNNGVNVSHMSGFTQMTNNPNNTNNNNNNNKTSGQFSATSQRSSATLAENKRKEFENLKVQVDGLKNENQLLQGKVKSLTSRKLILENEMKQLKSEFEKKKQIFAQKSENDDKFILLLKNQNEKLKKNEKVITKVIYKDTPNPNIQEQINNLKKQNINLLKKLQQFNKQIIIPPQKDLKNNIRQVSAQKKKQLQEQYIRSNKYLKKLNAEEESQIYKKWKEGKN